MNDTDIQWHPGFVSAMELELIDYKGRLYFDSEHNLSKKPLQIDLLVIKKNEPVEITNEIGRIFKKYNVMEYKSPDDSLNIDTFCKVQAYATLYKSEGSTANEKQIKDVTVSLVRERKPTGLFKDLGEMDMEIEMPFKGVYYIKNNIMFAIQVIVTSELPGDRHGWIKSLSHKTKIQDIKKLLDKTKKFKGEHEKELAYSVLEVALRANKTLVDELKGDDEMSSLLLELAEPLIQEREKSAEIRGIQKGIFRTVNTLRSLNHNNDEIKLAIMKNYDLSDEKAEKYL